MEENLMDGSKFLHFNKMGGFQSFPFHGLQYFLAHHADDSW